MSTEKGAKKKKKAGAEMEVVTWQQKKMLADKEEEELGKEVEELVTWTSLIEAMDEQQLKEYVLNRPENLQSVKTVKSAPSKRVQRSVKSKGSTSNGLMASIWKFHKEDD